MSPVDKDWLLRMAEKQNLKCVSASGRYRDLIDRSQVFGPWKYDAFGQTVRTADDQRAVCDIRGFGGLASNSGEIKAAEIEAAIEKIVEFGQMKLDTWNEE